MSEKPKEELKIKDLLIKLQVLTNGLIEERKKSQSYLDRIKEYEDSLQKKDSEIVELRKEKFDLKSKLTLEKSKQGEKKADSYLSSLLKRLFLLAICLIKGILVKSDDDILYISIHSSR